MIASSTAPARMRVGAGLRAVIAAAGVFLFFTGLDNYAFAFWAAPPPIFFVLIFVVAAAALVVFNATAPIPILRSPILLWVLAYFVVTTAWAVGTIDSPAGMDALRTRYRSAGFLVAFAVLFDDERARRVGSLAVAASVVFASCLNAAELLRLVTFAGQETIRVTGRAAGVYINPNGAGIAIVFGLAVVIGRVPMRYRVPLLVIGMAGVLATFSRGAAACFAVLVFVLLWRRKIGLWPVAIACSVIALLVMTHAESMSRLLGDVLTGETSARLHFAQDDSGRAILARNAWRLFLDSPLVGHGVGATIQPHNQFLALAGDHGVVGLLLLPALVAALVVSNPGAVPFAVVLMLAGLFSHNLLDDRASLLVIALAAAQGRDALDASGRARAADDLATAETSTGC